MYRHQTVLITGATSGNGQALALSLIDQGAYVVALGRNQVRLRELSKNRGVETFKVDLTDFEALDKFIVSCGQLDHVFHLAGNAVLGPVSTSQKTRFQDSDLHGPIILMEGLLPKVNHGGTVATVTSVAAALGDIEHILLYQQTKREMVRWWHRSRDRYTAKGLNLMLISMGLVDTGIWDRGVGLGKLTRKLVSQFSRGPESYTEMMLRDAKCARPVSYPGQLAGLAPLNLRTGCYNMNPLLKMMMTESCRAWFQLDR